MRTEISRCSVRTAVAALVGIVSVAALCILYVVVSHHKSSNTIAVKNTVRHVDNPKNSIAVLLQQSQVQTGSQVKRLRGIDASWATWATAAPSSGQILIYAAVPHLVGENTAPGMSNIRTFYMLPQTPSTVCGSPYHQMINSLYQVVSDATMTATRWILMANDHTFLLPPNLMKFLNTLDSEVTVYSGNELRIMYNRGVLSFASGGAGAVMSHPLVKLMLVVWVLAEGSASSLPWQQPDNEFSVVAKAASCTADSIVLDLRGSGVAVSAALRWMFQWKTGGNRYSETESAVCGPAAATLAARSKVNRNQGYCQRSVHAIYLLSSTMWFLAMYAMYSWYCDYPTRCVYWLPSMKAHGTLWR
jgi:hypothetical protein